MRPCCPSIQDVVPTLSQEGPGICSSTYDHDAHGEFETCSFKFNPLHGLLCMLGGLQSCLICPCKLPDIEITMALQRQHQKQHQLGTKAEESMGL